MEESAVSRPVALVLRARGLGDLLTAVPALRALRRALPEHRIVVATRPWLTGLVTTIDAVDDVHPTRELAPLSWAGHPPDLAVNLHGPGPQSHQLLLDISPHRLVAFGRPDLGVPGPVWNPEEHERARWCRLMTSTWDVRADPDDVRLPPPMMTPRASRVAIVHPGAESASRRWPPERFAAVARWLRKHDVPVIVTGSRSERRLTTRVVRLAGLLPGANLAGRTDLMTLASLVASARLVVSNDTGVAHLASAYRVPSVVLFGPTLPRLWGPPADGPHVAMIAEPPGAEDVRGSLHGYRLDPRLERIQPSDVIATAAALLGARV